MLNLKKGLALVLAAATAFTFAPVANLESAVTANAAATIFDKIGDQTLTVGEAADYEINIPNLSTGAKFDASTSDSSVARIGAIYVNNQTVTDATATYATAGRGYNDGNGGVKNVPNGSQIRIFTNPDKTGKATIDIAYTPQGGTKQHKTFVITVNAKSDVFTCSQVYGDDTNNDSTHRDAGYGLGQDYHVYVYTAPDIQDPTKWDAVKITDAPNGNHYALKSAEILSGGSSYVTLGDITKGDAAETEKSTGSVKIKFIKKGTATLRLQATNTSDNKDRHIDVVINVWNADSTMKIGQNEITNASDTSDIVKKTITLTADNPTGEIGAALDDAKVGEKLTYAVYSVTKAGLLNNAKKDDDSATNGTDGTAQNAYHAQQNHNTVNDITVDNNGKITATANALNATEQYYDILVTNNKVNGSTGKAAWVRVITIRRTKDFTSLDVNVDEPTKTQKYNVKATYAENGDVADGSDTKSLKLSTKDFSSTPYTALANGKTTVVPTSSDSSVVAVENGKLVAKKTGYSVLTFEAKSDVTYYGNATLKLQVTVVDQYIANKIDAENVNLTLQNKKATIAPSSTPKTTYHFTIGHAGTDGKWVEETDSHLTLNKATGEVTFDGLGIGSAQVQITGDAVNGVAEAPIAKVITVSYTNLKESDLNVTTKSLSLSEGETGAIVASGTALSYVSSDEDVATVDSTGNVTGVNAGTAVITVQSKGNDYVAAATDTVIVTVKAAAQKPAKVTGLKVSNKKGAYVSVKWTSQGKNINYRVWKKVGNGKWVGKNVAGSKTTLSVKKGAKVQVKVKAYVKDTNGKTTWGPTATKAKTFKTDKK
jgi:hypothetical protein